MVLNATTFATSCRGASHAPKGEPCQDYSLQYADSDAQLIVVCDGHGSSTYVRSDAGARLAAEIAKEELLRFMRSAEARAFLENQAGAVTARTDVGDSCWSAKQADMTESACLREEQANLYQSQIANIQPQESKIRELCASICEKWKVAIQKDAVDNPFTDAEKERLGKADLVKAYGTTLMAYIQVEWGWLAIHIGDGRLLCLNKDGETEEWKSLVPWDCACFLNYTTSLCNAKPVEAFRYAFDGTKKFPAAVLGCSDGVEDSLGDYDVNSERLHGFFSKIMAMVLEEGVANATARMETGLTAMSENGSKDDMSLAGIINP